jgi:hypothetical protein
VHKGGGYGFLGLSRLWAYNLLRLLQGRYVRAARSRRLTLPGFVAWLEQVSAEGEARRRGLWVAPTC